MKQGDDRANAVFGFKDYLEVYHPEHRYLAHYLNSRSLTVSDYTPFFLQWNGSTVILDRLGIEPKEFEKLEDDRYENSELDDKFYQVCDTIDQEMTEPEKEAFVSYLMNKHPMEAPAWGYFSILKNRIPRTTWLVHFTDDADSIITSGFTKGISDHERLALTTFYSDESKKFGGFNFAFI